MKAIMQRVSTASVSINEKIYSQIGQGLLVLLGITQDDTQEDVDWLCKKIIGLRIFSDHDGKMNLSVKDIKGEILLVSQFTLYASTKKGNRPSFTEAAPPTLAIPLYQACISRLQNELGKNIKTGQFGADMQVSLVNDGPVTIVIDTKDKK